jgi:hypothetical protein
MTVDDQGRPGDGPGLLTLTEAAARTGYSRDALRQRIRRGKLSTSKGTRLFRLGLLRSRDR